MVNEVLSDTNDSPGVYRKVAIYTSVVAAAFPTLDITERPLNIIDAYYFLPTFSWLSRKAFSNSLVL